MSADPGKPQSILSLIFDFFKLMAAVVGVLALMIFAATHGGDGPPLIQKIFETISESLTNPAPWVIKALVFGFFGLVVIGAYARSREHPEEGSFGWILFKAWLALLFGLPLLVIMVFVLYTMMFG